MHIDGTRRNGGNKTRARGRQSTARATTPDRHRPPSRRAATAVAAALIAAAGLTVLLAHVAGGMAPALSWLPMLGAVTNVPPRRDSEDAVEGREPDRPIVGDDNGGDQQVTLRARKPTRGRRRQEDEFKLLRTKELLAQKQAPTQAEAEALVRGELAEHYSLDEDATKAIAKARPQLTVVPSTEVDRDIELAAIFRLPVLIWLRLWLGGCLNGPKTKVGRTFGVAVGLEMGLNFGRKCAWRVREMFRKANPVAMWAHLYPTDPGPDDRSRFYRQLGTMFGAGRDYRVWSYVNRELVMQLAGELVVREHKNGKRTTYFTKVPDALKYLVVDAVLVEADIPQRKPVDDRHRQLMRGAMRRRCGFLTYTRIGAQLRVFISRLVHGYKWLEIVDLKMQVPLAGILIPANASERYWSLKLLEQVIALYPELKQMKEYFLVGDALYDQQEQYAYDLLIRFGCHGVFPRAGKVSETKYDWVKTGGVPKCDCEPCECEDRAGCEHGHLAEFDQAVDWPTAEYRLKNGLPAVGQWCIDEAGRLIDSARIRWKCPNGVAGCKPPATYFRENARLYTYLPHGGDHERHKLRDALLAYRNVIEAGFAWAEDLGLAGEGLMRPRWAKDPQMEHFAWMVAVSRTARKVIHQANESATTPYERARRQAEALGLLRMSTAEQPGSNIGGRTPAEVAVMRQQWVDQMHPPAGWEQTALRIPNGWPGAGEVWRFGDDDADDDREGGGATGPTAPAPAGGGPDARSGAADADSSAADSDAASSNTGDTGAVRMAA